jgi:hypothetical protein
MQIDFPDYEEEVYELDNITIEFLYDSQTIWSEDNVFILQKLSDFKEIQFMENIKYVLTNEDSILQINQEQYNIIKDLFIQKGRKLE